MPPTTSPNQRRRFRAAAIVLLLGILVVTFVKVGPGAPHEIFILTGEPGTTYHEYGKRYVAFLSAKGLTAHLVETEGSLDNLRRLSAEEPDNRAAAGFVQSGIDRELEDTTRLAGIVSLGSIAFEPFWVFVRNGDTIESIRDLAGQRVAIGVRGSGSRATALLLFEDNGITDEVVFDPFAHIHPEDAHEELLAGRIDAVCAVGETRSPAIARLLESDGLRPLSLPRTAAYARRHPEAEELVLPAGAFDVARDIPPVDLNLVAPATNLVTREDLHPAAIGILLEAAREIHRSPTLFAPEGTFPSSRYVSLPLNAAALRYYEDGVGTLHKLLPFWLATSVSWLVVVLTPFATAAFFLFKAVPGLVRLWFSIRLQQLYRSLERIEKEDDPEVDKRPELDQLLRESGGLNVPRTLVAPYFEFRQNVHDVRERLKTI